MILNLCEKLEQSRQLHGLLSFTYMLLGLYHRRTDDMPNSLYTLKHAKEIARQSSEIEYMGSILLNLSAIQLQMGYLEECIS